MPIPLSIRPPSFGPSHEPLPDPVNVQSERAARQNMREASRRFYRTVLSNLQMMLEEDVPLARVNRVMSELAHGHEAWLAAIADIEDGDLKTSGAGDFGLGGTGLGGTSYQLQQTLQDQSAAQRIRALTEALKAAENAGDTALRAHLLAALRIQTGLPPEPGVLDAIDPIKQYQDASFHNAEAPPISPPVTPYHDPLTPNDGEAPF